MRFLLYVLCLLLFSQTAQAGNQQYEVLKGETQQLMSQMVADNPPKNSSFSTIAEEVQWLGAMDKHLSRFVPNPEDRLVLLKTVHYEALRAGLDPELVLGLMQVESGFKKYAVSEVGARGYMQVMPFWKDLIGDQAQDLFYMRTNLRYGCTILRHYLDLENGNLFLALGRYNGSRGQAAYPDAVLAATQQFRKD